LAFAYVAPCYHITVAHDGDNGVWRGNIGRVYADLRHNADGKGHGYDCGFI